MSQAGSNEAIGRSGAGAGAGYVALRDRARGYLPGWMPRDPSAGTGEGPIDALLQVAGRYHDLLNETLERAGEKARIAHLDALGVSLRPARTAKGWVAFTLDPEGPDSLAPRGTKLAASPPGAPAPIVFETLDPLTLAAAPLAEAVIVDPERDVRIDLLAPRHAIEPEPYKGREIPIPHELYLGHPSALAVNPGSRVVVTFALADSAPEGTLDLVFELFDGTAWRPMAIDEDETRGLSRSGAVTLLAGPFTSAPTVVQDVRSHWVRLHASLKALRDRGGPLPVIVRVRVQSIVEPSVWSLTLDEPTPATYEGAKIAFEARDEQGLVFPPEVALPRLVVAPLEADSLTAMTPVATDLGLAPTITDSRPVRLQLQGPSDSAGIVPVLAERDVTLRENTGVKVVATRTAPTPTKAFADAMPVDPTSTFAPFGENPRPGASFVFTHPEIFAIPNTEVSLLLERVEEAEEPDDAKADASSVPIRLGHGLNAADAKLDRWVTRPWGWIKRHWLLWGSGWLTAGLGGGAATWGWLPIPEKTPFSQFLQDSRAIPAYVVVVLGLVQLILAPIFRHLTSLASADPAPVREKAKAGEPAAAPAKPKPSSMADLLSQAASPPPATRLVPVVALEAWNGAGWTTLMRSDDVDAEGQARGASALSLEGPKNSVIRFTVPEVPIHEWNGEPGHWVRLRLVSGGFGVKQLLPESGLSVILPHPPRLHAPRLIYRRATPEVQPLAVFSNNDDEWLDQTPGLNQAGRTFSPFDWGNDETATLYLGFAGALPSGWIGLGFRKDEGRGDGPTVVGISGTTSEMTAGLAWEAAVGDAWTALDAKDGTAEFGRTGLARLLWPPMQEPPNLPFLSAEGRSIAPATGSTLLDRSGISLPIEVAYPPLIDVVVRDEDGFERAKLLAVSANKLVLDRPLSRAYKTGWIEPWRLARFGTPRSWIRIRRRDDGTFPTVRPGSISPNAVAVEQGETRTDELLGSGTGMPRQVFALSNPPILEGETIEVKELSGSRAEIEWRVLEEELRSQRGVGSEDLRLVHDPRTGTVNAVWVRWRNVSDLSGAGPHDRVYSLERAEGRVIFGDNHRGRIPPVGPNAILARSYRVGGGRSGNVAAGAINAILGSLPNVQAVTNPVATAGGVDGETLEVSRQNAEAASQRVAVPSDPISRFLDLHPALSTRGAGVLPADLEALAGRASAGVIGVLYIRAGDIPGGPAYAGARGRLVVLAQDDRATEPVSGEASSDPHHLTLSPALRQRIRDALGESLPAWIADRIEITGPEVVPVEADVQVLIQAGLDPDTVRHAVVQEIGRYLDPRTGGPKGEGWLSTLRGASLAVSTADLARRLSIVPGVARTLAVRLARGGLTGGDRLVLARGAVAVPAPDRIRAIVVADVNEEVLA